MNEKTILIIDDDESIGNFEQELLQRSGYADSRSNYMERDGICQNYRHRQPWTICQHNKDLDCASLFPAQDHQRPEAAILRQCTSIFILIRI